MQVDVLDLEQPGIDQVQVVGLHHHWIALQMQRLAYFVIIDRKLHSLEEVFLFEDLEVGVLGLRGQLFFLKNLFESALELVSEQKLDVYFSLLFVFEGLGRLLLDFLDGLHLVVEVEVVAEGNGFYLIPLLGDLLVQVQ